MLGTVLKRETKRQTKGNFEEKLIFMIKPQRQWDQSPCAPPRTLRCQFKSIGAERVWPATSAVPTGRQRVDGERRWGGATSSGNGVHVEDIGRAGLQARDGVGCLQRCQEGSGLSFLQKLGEVMKQLKGGVWGSARSITR